MERKPTSTASGAQAAVSPHAGHAGDCAGVGPVRQLTIGLDDFTWRALEEEAGRLEVSIDELAGFAVLYYLADHDSGRIARRPLQPSDFASELGGSHPLRQLLGD